MNDTDKKNALRHPEDCKRCVNFVRYITDGREQQMCSNGKPMRDECLWFIPRPYYERQRT